MQIKKEDRKKANQKAHLNKLKDELSSVTQELNSKLNTLNQVKEESQILANKNIKHQEEIELRNKELNTRLLEITAKETLLSNREDVLARDEKEYRQKLDSVEKAHKDKLVILETAIASNKEALRTSELELSELLNKISDARNILNNLSKEEKIINLQVQSITRELEAKQQEIMDVETRLQKALEKKAKELDSIQQRVYEEQKKIEMPLNSLKAQEAELKRRKKNIDIVAMRLNKYVSKYFPNQNIKL